ncbi:MAG TPA: antibiotic biosynthesis monooxygenase [Geobacteraceae bacterium]|nr:antibiotic biosynthesis monooxygenase [Geobacteraceae bacterium]
MIMSMVKICPAPGKDQEILDILLSVRGPTLAASGCIECSIYEEHDDEHAIVYVERWKLKGALIDHIRSALYTRVLKSLELSVRQPEICFYEISGTLGMDLIEKVRSSGVETWKEKDMSF